MIAACYADLKPGCEFAPRLPLARDPCDRSLLFGFEAGGAFARALRGPTFGPNTQKGPQSSTPGPKGIPKGTPNVQIRPKRNPKKDLERPTSQQTPKRKPKAAPRASKEPQKEPPTSKLGRNRNPRRTSKDQLYKTEIKY